jgi:hypothetical protein
MVVLRRGTTAAALATTTTTTDRPYFSIATGSARRDNRTELERLLNERLKLRSRDEWIFEFRAGNRVDFGAAKFKLQEMYQYRNYWRS